MGAPQSAWLLDNSPLVCRSISAGGCFPGNELELPALQDGTWQGVIADQLASRQAREQVCSLLLFCLHDHYCIQFPVFTTILGLNINASHRMVWIRLSSSYIATHQQ